MSSIGRQQEIIIVLNVTDRIDTPKGKVNETRKRAHYMDVSPLPISADGQGTACRSQSADAASVRIALELSLLAGRAAG